MKRIALIGCGAIARSFHLPALTRHSGEAIEVVLVDPDVERARSLGADFGVTNVASSHRDVADELDAAVIATPHHLHVPIATDLVGAGVHVLSEKPLGTTVAEVEGLRDLAAEHGVVVAVNQTRRFIPAAGDIRRRIQAGELGQRIEVDANEGDRFGWPAATPSMFGARSGGKGLLLDIGAHVLDMMVWWFGPDLEVEEYRDESMGGSEASVLARLRSDRVAITVRLSWLAKQRNAYRIVGDAGRIDWGVYDLDEYRLSGPDGSGGRAVTVPGAPGSLAALGPRVLTDFLDAVAGKGAPMAGPADVLPSMHLMDTCYGSRSRFDMPWHAFERGTA